MEFKPPLSPEIAALREQVQRNCAIADARYAREQSLCSYLLNMREFYRWANDLPLEAPLPPAAVGAWIRQQEAEWDRLASEPWQSVTIAGETFDPFDEGALNQHLIPLGWTYTAGVGRFGKPHFSLAPLVRREQIGPLTCWYLGKEVARDSSLVPAAYRQGQIFLRLDAIRRLAWEKWSLWQSRPQELLARQRVVEEFTTPEGKGDLTRLSEAVTQLLVRHEVGEAEVAHQLPPERWHTLLAAAGNRTNELFLRAVRDQLADALAVLPFLAEGDESLVHLHFALPEGMARQLMGRSYENYTMWAHHPDAATLRTLAEAELAHWQRYLEEVLTRFTEHPEGFTEWVTEERERLLARKGR